MKKIKNIAIFLTAIFIWSCSSNIGTDEGEYSPPSIKSQTRLIFPISAQAKGIHGITNVMISVAKDGSVKNVKIVESSGYDDLDAAALSYCKKLQFNPATRGNEAVPSFVKLKVNFNYKNDLENSEQYVNEVLSLYERISASAETKTKTELQKELFNKHIEFVEEMGGEIKFNSFAKRVIQEKSLPEWGNIWDSYPLTFLLFHDFLQRYPDCQFSSEVKSELEKSLKNDIYFIKNSPALGAEERGLKESVLLKIKSFVSQHYPGIKLSFNNFEINA